MTTALHSVPFIASALLPSLPPKAKDIPRPWLHVSGRGRKCEGGREGCKPLL